MISIHRQFYFLHCNPSAEIPRAPRWLVASTKRHVKNKTIQFRRWNHRPQNKYMEKSLAPTKTHTWNEKHGDISKITIFLISEIPKFQATIFWVSNIYSIVMKFPRKKKWRQRFYWIQLRLEWLFLFLFPSSSFPLPFSGKWSILEWNTRRKVYKNRWYQIW